MSRSISHHAQTGKSTTLHHTVKKLISIFILLMITASSLAAPSASASRRSPEFIINEPSGKTTLLSSFKGKVVVMEFLFLRSAHCMRVAQSLNKLQQQLGPRGFQPVAIAFPAPGSDANGAMVSATVNYFQLAYPVGYTTKSEVDSYLGRTNKEILNIPQVVVIDRAGMIRAASGDAGGNPKLEDEGSLRMMIEELLNEQAPATSGSRKK